MILKVAMNAAHAHGYITPKAQLPWDLWLCKQPCPWAVLLKHLLCFGKLHNVFSVSGFVKKSLLFTRHEGCIATVKGCAVLDDCPELSRSV